MTAPSVSVVIVSRDRPELLGRCLLGVSQLYHQNFEVVVVADENSRAGIEDTFADKVKFRAFEEPNISAARNIGIAASAGDIVAFIDDDAVPEPTWLDHLTGAFASSDVAAAGGYVIGRNGISFQWRAQMAFADGQAVEIPHEDMSPFVPPAETGRAIKTEGTNMAFRRDVLLELGGFDEAFEFYLDETDLNMRLAAAGYETAIVPLAQVHHGFAESRRRTNARVPRSLGDIGRSLALFARKHGASLSVVGVTHRRQQRARLLRYMQNGDLAPGSIKALMRTFDEGWAKGRVDSFDRTIDLPDVSPPPFKPFESTFEASSMEVMRGRFWQKRSILEQALAQIKRGKRVSVYLLSLSSLFHHVRFAPSGVWIQQGGQFGRSDRKGSIFQLISAKRRTRNEVTRVVKVRQDNTERALIKGMEKDN